MPKPRRRVRMASPPLLRAATFMSAAAALLAALGELIRTLANP